MLHKNKPLITIVMLFSLLGCGSSSITYMPQHLALSLNETKTTLQTTLVEQKLENYSNLYLTHRLLRLGDGSFVVYEEAMTDEQFEFEHTTTRATSIVFDTKKMYKVYANNHLYAFQLLLPNNKMLNLIAQQDDTQELKFIYGMSTKKLDQILKHIDKNAKNAYYKDVITIDNIENSLWSNWTTWKIHFTPLITPIRQLGGL